MRNYTEALIESTEDALIEAYQSQAAANESDREAAEKIFQNDLTIPNRKVTTLGKWGPWQKSVGTFNLEDFHKAYDAELEQLGVLDKLFADDGKFKHKGVYGILKNDLDQNAPLTKVLKQMWGIQYSNGYGVEFDIDIKAAEEERARIQKAHEEEKAAEEEKKKRFDQCTEEQKKREAEIKLEIKKRIEQLSEYNDLRDFYEQNVPEYKEGDFEIGARVDFSYDQSNYDVAIWTNPLAITTWLNGTLKAPVNNSNSIKIEVAQPADQTNLEKAYQDVAAAMKTKLAELLKISKAALFFVTNRVNLEQRPEMVALKSVHKEATISSLTSDKYGLQFNWICYYDPKSQKYYKCIYKDFGQTGIMLYNVKDKNDKLTSFNPGLKVVAARYTQLERSNYLSRGETEKITTTDYFNTGFDTSIYKDLYVETTSYNYSNICTLDTNEVSIPEQPLDKFFNQVSVKEYKRDNCD